MKQKINEKVRKKVTIKLEFEKFRQNIFCPFFKCSLNFRDHALQLELTKVILSNFVKFRLQSMSFKIERACEKRTTFSIKIGPKRKLFRQQKGP